MPVPNSVDLIELPAKGAAAVETSRAFYSAVFGWTFTSYGPEYIDTREGQTALGVNGSDDRQQAAPLPVVYVTDLVATRASIVKAGGRVLHDIYSFPGGRRFHFVDPNGNELAAWSDL